MSSITYVDKWFLHEDGSIDAEFRDGTGMKIRTSPIHSIDEMTVITTETGLRYSLGDPLFNEYWPGNVPAGIVREALFLSIACFQHHNLDGKHLWEMFQDELACRFAEQKIGR